VRFDETFKNGISVFSDRQFADSVSEKGIRKRATTQFQSLLQNFKNS
jgi:hypothetical protein